MLTFSTPIFPPHHYAAPLDVISVSHGRNKQDLDIINGRLKALEAKVDDISQNLHAVQLSMENMVKMMSLLLNSHARHHPEESAAVEALRVEQESVQGQLAAAAHKRGGSQGSVSSWSSTQAVYGGALPGHGKPRAEGRQGV